MKNTNRNTENVMRNAHIVRITHYALLYSCFMLVFFVVGCSSSTYSTAATTTTTAATTTTTVVFSGAATVEISGSAFNPSTITVTSGTTVTWTNKDATAHTVTKSSGPDNFGSGTLSQNGAYSFQFMTAGTNEYFCGFHSFMTGKVIVQ